MADTSDATGPKTPPGSSSLFPPEIKSTPNAVGSASMSENIGALGAECVTFNVSKQHALMVNVEGS